MLARGEGKIIYKMFSLILAFALLAGCSSSHLPATKPAGPTAVTFAQDQVVFQIFSVVPRSPQDRPNGVIPEVSLWGDGRLVFINPTGYVKERRLASNVVQDLMQSLVSLYAMQDSYGQPVPDGVTTFFTIATERGQKTIRVDDGADPVLMKQLRTLTDRVALSAPVDSPEMQPERVRVIARPADGEKGAAAEWPSGLVGELSGEQAKRATKLGGLGPARLFTLDGRVRQLLVVPVLPVLTDPKVTK